MLPNTPAFWDGGRWVVHSTFPLTAEQLGRVGAWLRRVQMQRRLGLPPGDRRDELDRTVRALDEGRIVCGLVPQSDGQTYTAYRATEGTGRVYSMGALH